MSAKLLLCAIIPALCIILHGVNPLYAGKNRDVVNVICDCDLAKVKDAVNKGADLSMCQDIFGPLNLETCFSGYGDAFDVPNNDAALNKNITMKANALMEYLLEHGVNEIPFFQGAIFTKCYPETFDVLKKHNAIGKNYLLMLARHGCSSKDILSPIKTIVAADIDVNSVDHYGKTALMYLSRHAGASEYLISKGGDVHKKDNNGQTALSWASWYGNTEVVNLLITTGSDVNVMNKTDRNTPLLFAVHKGFNKIVKRLIEAKANVNAKNRAGLTPYQVALFRGDAETAETLKKAGADTKAAVVNQTVSFFMEPVHIPLSDNAKAHKSVANYLLKTAYESKAEDMVKKAVDAGADVKGDVMMEILQKETNTSLGKWLKGKGIGAGIISPAPHPFPYNEELVEEAGKGNTKRVKELIDAGIDVDTFGLLFQSIRDHRHSTALMKASLMGKYDVVKLLIESGADVNIKDSDGVNALNYALSHGSIVKLLIKAGADINRKNRKSSSTPLLGAVLQDNAMDPVKALIDAKANLDAANKFGRTALMEAVSQRERPEIAKLLVKSGARVNLKNHDGTDALAIAASMGNVEMLDLLLLNGADPNSRNNHLVSPLMHASANGKSDAAKKLISKGAEVNATDDDGYTPLLYAVKSGDPVTVECLIAHKALASTRAQDGMTPLLMESFDPDLRIRKALLDAGAKADKDFTSDQLKFRLFKAASMGNPGSVRRLIAEKADVNARDSLGRTPLYRACWSGNADNVLMLLKAGVDVNVKAIDGSTPLIAACISYDFQGMGQPFIVKMLLDAGANVNAADRFGRTALMITAQNWYLDSRVHIMKELLKAGADVNIKNKMGLTPIFHALGSAIFDNRLLDMLIDAGADVNVRTEKGVTPLMFYCSRNKDTAPINRLLHAGADINARDKSGHTALSYAIASDVFENVGYLLKKGASQTWDSRYYLGLCSLFEKKYGEAAVQLKLAAKLKKDHRIYCDLGLAYFGQKKYRESEMYLKEAQAIAPGDPMPLYHLACLFGQKKDSLTAMHYLKGAISLGYKNYYRIMSEKSFTVIKGRKDFKKIVKAPGL